MHDYLNLIRILHVDDEPADLEITRVLLKRRGKDDFEICSFLSAKEAIKRLKKEHFDIIISDYKMPVMNGLELLEKLRWKGNDIPFVVFTGKGNEEVEKEAFKRGADQYISKAGKTTSQCRELARAIWELVMKRRIEEFQKSSLEIKETI
jgi:CheY-like chemotaxis protein